MERLESRKEFVGKRILASELKKKEYTKCDKFSWNSGIIRCVTSKDVDDDDFMLCVEWDDQPWEEREWISFDNFQVVFIENSVATTKQDTTKEILPVLTFSPHKGNVVAPQYILVEFLNDSRRVFLKETAIVHVEKECDLTQLHCLTSDIPLYKRVLEWINLQRTQKALLKSASTHCLAGTRVLVYWHSSSVQWINALITGQDVQGMLHIMTEQVLTETTVDPSQTQVCFLDNTVVDDMLSGNMKDNIRRSRRSTRNSLTTTANETSSQRRSSARRKSSSARDQSTDAKTSDTDSKPSTNSTNDQTKTEVESVPKSTNINVSTSIPSSETSQIRCERSSPKKQPDKLNESGQNNAALLPQFASNEQDSKLLVEGDCKNDHNLHRNPFEVQFDCDNCDDSVRSAASSLLSISSKFKNNYKSSIGNTESNAFSKEHTKAHTSNEGASLKNIYENTSPHSSEDPAADRATHTVHVPTPIMPSKPNDVAVVLNSPVITSQSSFVPNSHSGSFEVYKKKISTEEEKNGNAAKSEDINTRTTMHQSQHSRVLLETAAQQQVLRQQQQQQQQQQQPQLTQLPGQQPFLTHPYLNTPYGLQLFYGNPALAPGGLNATALAQARLQAVARTLPHQLMAPWLLEKELQQQHALATFWRNMPEGLPAYPALYQPDPAGTASPKLVPQTSPGKEAGKIHPEHFKQEKIHEAVHSPNPVVPKKVSQLSKLSTSPRRPPLESAPDPTPHSHPYSHPVDHATTSSPHRSDVPYAKHNPSPNRMVPHGGDLIIKERDQLLRRQEEEKRQLEEEQKRKFKELEEDARRKEEIYKAMKAKVEEQNKIAAEKSHMVDQAIAAHSRSDKPSSHPWFHEQPHVPGNMPHAALGMVDPATMIAFNAARYETMQKSNGLNEKERHESRISPAQTSQPSQRVYPTADVVRQKQQGNTTSPGQTVASSSKIWQPPLLSEATKSLDGSKEKHKTVLTKTSGQNPTSHPVDAVSTVPSSTINPYHHHLPQANNPYYNYMMPGPQHSSGGGPSKLTVTTHTPTQAAVFNINSLKYSPSSQQRSSPTSAKSEVSQKSGFHNKEKGVVVKSSPAAAYREGHRDIRYITERDTINHRPYNRTPSPERLGPLMADGSRAKILSQASLNSLYHFPRPSIMSTAKSATDNSTHSVIINGGHYKVTEVHGGKECIPTEVSSSPTHVLYQKPTTTAPRVKVEQKDLSPKCYEVKPSNAMDVKTEPPEAHTQGSSKDVRKRTSAESNSQPEVLKKVCKELTQPPVSRGAMYKEINPHVMKNFSPDIARDPYLRELAAAGYFGIRASNVSWGDTSKINNQYPGAPSKHILKDALMKNENGLNLSTAKPQPSAANDVNAKNKINTNERQSPKISNFVPPVSKSDVHANTMVPSPNGTPINYSHYQMPSMSIANLVNGNAKSPNPSLLNQQASSPSCKVQQKPSDFSMNSRKNESDVPKNLVKSLKIDVESKPKTPNSNTAVSPGSDASSISDYSWGSTSSKSSVRPPSGDGNPPVAKPSSCPKMKKEWLKRMSDESDDATKSPAAKPFKRKNSSDLQVSPLTDMGLLSAGGENPVDTDKAAASDDLLAPPVKKPKKKHRKQDKERKEKDSNKPKKRKHKDKEGKKSRKSDSSPSHDPLEQSISSPSTPSAADSHDDLPKEESKDKDAKLPSKPKSQKRGHCVISNSKKYLLGQLLQPKSTSAEETAIGSEGDGNESPDGRKNKKKSCSKKLRGPPEMPLGQNGLPMSVLLCRKEQARLKRTSESFMQDAACHEITALPGITILTSFNGASLPKCRECRSVKRKENNAIFCRFYGFRKLAFINGQLQAAGFCDPEDSRISDLSLWLPDLCQKEEKESKDREEHPSLELEACKYIMRHIGGKFCELVQEEREAIAQAEETVKVSWKRPVAGVREMCDACETTLFNLHWVCQKCGFGVCSDCYKNRQGMSREELEAYDVDKNNLRRWMRCTKGKHHLPSHLIPTQIIPSTCLFDLCEMAHEARAKWSIKSQCRCKKSVKLSQSLLAPRSSDPTPLLKNHCNSSAKSVPNLANSNKMDISRPLSGNPTRDSNRFKSYDCESSASPLDWLASIALHEQRKSSGTPILTSTPSTKSITTGNDERHQSKQNKEVTAVTNCNPALRHTGLQPSSSHAPRSWLCNGELLQLTDSRSKVNIDAFQLHWFYGMPVMASGASSSLNQELWLPEKFTEQHGDEPTGNALVNCRKGSIITNAQLKDFWCGFESIENRLEDEKTGEKMILKLKDWPTADDFIDTMPDRFTDLMQALPLPQYTGREGIFNIAAQLPDFFVRPDLGPKMYIAYGWVSEDSWTQGTTNLHLDISDACNLMVYVGIPRDEPRGTEEKLFKIIKEGDVDDAQIERVKTHKPGALWHIFKASDTDKIRKLILKVKAEQGIVVSEDHDPIHDQQIYLDQNLRRRLREEYGVEGYPLVQCEGDSVFIPAGAPHQVFNLHSCIKVAEDFVSPEHVDKCFKLMEEFRYLSTTHSNHEDKLQLKNIIYHAMKEVLSSLRWYESRGGLELEMQRARLSVPPQG
ncbi:uncharacterized protein LOC143459469 isoform X3 [Clavelina lepadiformis]|uniref:uncharacterized protein LOC143459469 isoform X3 n=1 Tax=Clavelina lepadiformis TaxID=159417 RepID=UPI0040410D8B